MHKYTIEIFSEKESESHIEYHLDKIWEGLDMVGGDWKVNFIADDKQVFSIGSDTL